METLPEVLQTGVWSVVLMLLNRIPDALLWACFVVMIIEMPGVKRFMMERGIRKGDPEKVKLEIVDFLSWTMPAFMVYLTVAVLVLLISSVLKTILLLAVGIDLRTVLLVFLLGLIMPILFFGINQLRTPYWKVVREVQIRKEQGENKDVDEED